MKELNLLLIIAREKDHHAYEKYFSRHKLAAYASLPCHGTAQNKTLDLLGIEQTEKIMLTAVIGKQQTKDVLATLPDQMEIDIPGRGIGLIIPLNSMGGAHSMKVLTGSTEAEEREVIKMEFNTHLIVAVLNKGCSDIAMEAARAAGAGGGTVIRAKGTYGKGDEHFFGVTLAEEKDTVLIVATEAQRRPIMQALVNQAHEHPELGTVTFSIPVSDTMGLRLDRRFTNHA